MKGVTKLVVALHVVATTLLVGGFVYAIANHSDLD